MALEAGLKAAAGHRRRLRATRFIAVTGSCGKTTTKELIAAILGSQLRGTHTIANRNDLTSLGLVLLRTRRRHAFCVIEIGAWKPGSVARAAKVVAPQIAVVINVGRDHHNAFRTLEATAEEKRGILDACVAGAIAVLNADDPRVIAMADGFPGRVITFGRSPEAELSARDVSSAWPERLSFTLLHDGRSFPVQTRLCGKHWVSSALAALGVAVAMEIPIDRAVAALARVDPYPGRMSPVAADGVTFIRDDNKAPRWTMDATFEFLADATALRKILVVGTVSDYPGSYSSMYRSVARGAVAVSDETHFVGLNAKQALRPGKTRWPASLHAFETRGEVCEHLLPDLRDGDLVLLKGSGADRLDEIVLAYAARHDGDHG